MSFVAYLKVADCPRISSASAGNFFFSKVLIFFFLREEIYILLRKESDPANRLADICLVHYLFIYLWKSIQTCEIGMDSIFLLHWQHPSMDSCFM